MSEQPNWNNQFEDLGGGATSSQDTICSQDNSGFVKHGQISESGCFNGNQEQGQLHLPLSNALSTPNQPSLFYQDAFGPNMTVGQEISSSESANLFKLDPSAFINEDTQMFVTLSGNEGPNPMESPFDFASPGCEPGNISSPFEAMESDGLNDADDSACAATNSVRRPIWNNGHFSTTTPRDSSDEDHYESSGSRKKRRRTKREMHPSDNFTQSHFPYNSHSSQIASPVCLADFVNGSEQSCFSGLNFQKQRGSQQLVNNSDSNLYATIVKNKRRNSNASESNQSSVSCTKDHAFPIVENSMASVSSFMAESDLTNPGISDTQSKRLIAHDLMESSSQKPMSKLQGHLPSSASGCSLEILIQPEDQHRARYLTEGSRGPVKDRTQQGFPQIQLKGYSGKTTLHVYVGADTDDKVRPHGFYQACKVTGRNTTTCEEIEIEGTKVIQIPFDVQEPISVDCVGILKLRNADVELRIGPNRAKKRSQTVRLVFRVSLEIPGNDLNPLVLQVVSDRINCTQPRGQPEIVRKSLERCSVEGDQEVFIIGKNFHRGTKVVFQDSIEPDGSHWQQAGQIDKDTFNQSHLVVRIPPYHDKDITKSVNVQLFVEHDGKKCDPHSFTYDPSPAKLAQLKEAAASQEKESQKEPDDPLENILSKKNIDRKYLEKLVALVLSTGLSDVDSNDVKPQIQQTPLVAKQENSSTSNQAMELSPASAVQPNASSLPLFTADSKQLPSTVQKPVPIPVQTASQIPATSRMIIRRQTFMPASQASTLAHSVVPSTVLMSTQPFKPSANSTISNAVTSQVTTGTFPSDQRLFQASTSSVFNTVSTTAVPVIVNVKSENSTTIWPASQNHMQVQPSIGIALQGTSGSITIPSQNVSLVNSSGQPVILLTSHAIQQQQTLPTNIVNQSVGNTIFQTQQQLPTQMLGNTASIQQPMISNVVTVVKNTSLFQQSQQPASMAAMVTTVNPTTRMPQMESQGQQVTPQQQQIVQQVVSQQQQIVQQETSQQQIVQQLVSQQPQIVQVPSQQPQIVTQKEQHMTMQQQHQITFQHQQMATQQQQLQQTAMSGAVCSAESNQQPMQSLPLERSTPVQEIIASECVTSFAPTSQNQWQSQVINAGPNLTFGQSQIPITTSQNGTSFVNNSLAQTITLNNNMTATSGVQANVFTNVPSTENTQQQVNQWVSGGDSKTQEELSSSISQMTSQTGSVSGQVAMQWQPAPEENSMSATPTIPHSNSGEFVFGSHSTEQSMATSQQQHEFTVPNAMDILDPPRHSDANMIPSLPDALSTPVVESHAPDMITPNVMPAPDQDLFDDQAVLQSILSDLSIPDAHSEQTPMAQDSRTANAQTVEFVTANSTQTALNQGEPILPQHQDAPADVEMVQAQIQKPVQTDEGHPVFMNQPVDPETFLIMLSKVQPQQPTPVVQHTQNPSMSNLDQSPISSNNFGLPDQMQPTLPLNDTSSAANVESRPSNRQFQTIDSSVLDLNTGNNNTMNQHFLDLNNPQVPTWGADGVEKHC